MGIRNNLNFGCLAKNLCQTADGDGTGLDQIGENRSWSHRWQLNKLKHLLISPVSVFSGENSLDVFVGYLF